jgi:hypothetical protein
MSSFSDISGSSTAAKRIEIILFDGKDFGLWKTRVEGLFMAHELLDAVENNVLDQLQAQEQEGKEAASAPAAPSKLSRQDSAAAAAKEEVRRKCEGYAMPFANAVCLLVR